MHVVRYTARSRRFSFRAKAKSPVTAANVTVELLPRTQTEGQDWHLRPTIYYKTLDVKCVLSSDEVQVKLKYIIIFCVLNSRLSKFAAVTHTLKCREPFQLLVESDSQFVLPGSAGRGCIWSLHNTDDRGSEEGGQRCRSFLLRARRRLRDFTREHRVQPAALGRPF